MFKKFSFFLIILFFFSAACRVEARTTGIDAGKAEITPAIKAPKKVSWQEEWEKTLSAAKKEGKVSISSGFGAIINGALSKAFMKKYNIKAEFTAGRGGEQVTKIMAERGAGLVTFDFIMAGASTMWQIPKDVLEPMGKALILPEVKDVNAWRGKKLPFQDKDGKIFMYIAQPGSTLFINTEMVKHGEIKSWRDLLAPKWKGKIILDDPSVPGPGNNSMFAAAEIMGMDFLRELAKQDPLVTKDRRLLAEWVARGKYPVAIGYFNEIVQEFRRAGAPLLLVTPSEGSFYGVLLGAIAMLDRMPHPNAAKVFINWLLSREGQILIQDTAQYLSARVDITQDLPADMVFQEGIKYISSDDDLSLKKRAEMLTLSKEIFAGQYK